MEMKQELEKSHIIQSQLAGRPKANPKLASRNPQQFFNSKLKLTLGTSNFFQSTCNRGKIPASYQRVRKQLNT
jgi:hypothetical protein